LPARLVERSRIVLLAAQGKQDIEIGEELSISPNKAGRWRNRFLDAGLEGLKKDAPRPGRTPRITRELVREVIVWTTQTKPTNATHWSTRTLAAELGISDSSVS
jgi:transposase